MPLNQLEVSVQPGGPASLTHVAWDLREPSRWRLVDLHVGKEYIGTLCAEGQSCGLRRWQWPRITHN